MKRVSTTIIDTYDTGDTHPPSLPTRTVIHQERFPVSKITVAALEDLGYIDDPSKVNCVTRATVVAAGLRMLTRLFVRGTYFTQSLTENKSR